MKLNIMALINCTECNKEISDKAEICVGCGAPLEKPIIIIGTTFIIGNLEVAQNDFPISMNWDDAVNACAELGEGWRLPNKDELDTLFKNKNLIFNDFSPYKIYERDRYWSSSEYNNKSAWGQDFSDGVQFYTNFTYGNANNKHLHFCVRAVRTIN